MSTRSPLTASAPVGKYALEVGAYAGSFTQFGSASSEIDKTQARKNAAELRAALAEGHDQQQTNAPLTAIEKLESTTDAVTDRVEHADKLFKAAAEGRLLDPRLLTDEVGALLGLLDRLDREGRYEEEIRVAKALQGLCVLAFRWLDLVRSLRRAFAAAQALDDKAAQAWVLNELGALHLCAGDARKAGEHLERALELYEKLGDAEGRCATRHNYDSARREVAQPIQAGTPRSLHRAGGFVRPLVAGIIGGAALVLAGFTLAPMASSSDDSTDELVVTIDEKPANPAGSVAATFSFSAAGAEGFECKLDDRAFRSCSSPMSYKNLAEGEHAFRVRAIAQDEPGPVTRHVWRIDLTAPTTTITDGPSNRTTRTSAEFSFVANEEVTGFECKLGDSPFAACSSPKSFLGPLEDGKYKFAVRAIDLAGNVGDAESYRWRVSVDRTTAVPPIVGLELDDGKEALAKAQLKWDVEQAESTQAVGQIVDQDPDANEEVPVGATVTVVVSAGMETPLPRELPDLTVEIPEDGIGESCSEDGCVTTVTFTIKNDGKGDITDDFEVLVTTNPDKRTTVTLRGGLAAGASEELTATLGPGESCFNPDCSARVEADPDGRVPELDELNNVAGHRRLG